MSCLLKTTWVSINKPLIMKSAECLFKRQLGLTQNQSRKLFLSTLKRDQKNDDGVIYEENFADISRKKLKKYYNEEKKYNGKLVYVGRLTPQLFRAKTLSLSSSVLGLLLLPFLNTTLSTSSIFSQMFVYGTTGFFIFVTPLFAQYLTRRYVSRLYFNYETNQFTAILFSFFMFEYKLEFNIGDVHVPDLPGAFTTVQLKPNKRNLFIDLNTLIDAQLVQKIYGYDKPFDVKKYTNKN